LSKADLTMERAGSQEETKCWRRDANSEPASVDACSKRAYETQLVNEMEMARNTTKTHIDTCAVYGLVPGRIERTDAR